MFINKSFSVLCLICDTFGELRDRISGVDLGKESDRISGVLGCEMRYLW
ncbi:hypothetical protein [Nodularia spumigena]|uniref:Uncharacterized protein n=1 Tax=Nodularia spumigena UHCC 0060 TaxID=3110300 RepID=A0ABU5URV3_NODSP|nr:hypothetical protein [Nodularia spumigena]MEA5526108.1 hypothetical protein [Nodularia spumigena UHCC 0143]MEA5609005.1 hypothetical protein [Nodularia spumigena UHCC 0060]